MVRILGLLLMALTCIPPAHAEEDPSKHEIGLMFGSAAPRTKVTIDSEDSLGATGVAAGVRYLYRISPIAMAGAEIQMLKPAEHKSRVLIRNGVSTTGFESVLALAEVKLRPRGARKVRPFGLAGMGFHSTLMKIDATPQSGFAWTDTGTTESRQAINSRKAAVALTLQGGVDFLIGERALLGLSGAWYHLGKADYAATDKLRNISPNFRGIEGKVSSLSVLIHTGARF